jgi:hypothetical protein
VLPRVSETRKGYLLALRVRVRVMFLAFEEGSIICAMTVYLPRRVKGNSR